MFGSDWPVALVACTYKHWIDVVERATASLSLLSGTDCSEALPKKLTSYNCPDPSVRPLQVERELDSGS